MSFAPNHTEVEQMRNDSDYLLRLCWAIQDSWPCVEKGPCSWCPTTSTCVPNTFRIPILAPIFDPDICPLWSERWELRARPLGPHVSTITFLTCIISVLGTFGAIALFQMGRKLWRFVRKRWSSCEEGWWKGWRLRLVDINRLPEPEQRPLLG